MAANDIHRHASLFHSKPAPLPPTRSKNSTGRPTNRHVNRSDEDAESNDSLDAIGQSQSRSTRRGLQAAMSDQLGFVSRNSDISSSKYSIASRTAKVAPALSNTRDTGPPALTLELNFNAQAKPTGTKPLPESAQLRPAGKRATKQETQPSTGHKGRKGVASSGSQAKKDVDVRSEIERHLKVTHHVPVASTSSSVARKSSPAKRPRAADWVLSSQESSRHRTPDVEGPVSSSSKENNGPRRTAVVPSSSDKYWHAVEVDTSGITDEQLSQKDKTRSLQVAQKVKKRAPKVYDDDYEEDDQTTDTATSASVGATRSSTQKGKSTVRQQQNILPRKTDLSSPLKTATTRDRSAIQSVRLPKKADKEITAPATIRKDANRERETSKTPRETSADSANNPGKRPKAKPSAPAQNRLSTAHPSSSATGSSDTYRTSSSSAERKPLTSCEGSSRPLRQSGATPAMRENRIVDVTSSSPAKPSTSASRNREAQRGPPITLSSQREPLEDDDAELSVEVVSGASASASSSRAHGTNRRFAEGLTMHARGTPTAPFAKQNRQGDTAIEVHQISGRNRRAKPSAVHKTGASSRSIEPMQLSALQKTARNTPDSSLNFRYEIGSPQRDTRASSAISSAKKRRSPPTESSSPRNGKRRSLHELDNGNVGQESFDRSDSPFEQTQALWKSAAGNTSHDSDLDFSSDSDGDVSLNASRRTVLCPFCDAVLPDKPTAVFVQMLDRLCSRVDLQVRRSAGNSFALSLPLADTVSACKRHRDEDDIIPAGVAAGYPTEASMDWDRFKGVLETHCRRSLTSIISGTKTSSFEEAARLEWADKGNRKMGNIMNEWATFHQEVPGYYGQKGFNILMNFFTESLIPTGLITEKRTQPLDAESYLRRVLVPEAAVYMIKTDNKCTRAEACRILEESRDYGTAVFGESEVNGPLFAETQRERQSRRAEEIALDSQRDQLLGSQGDEAEALKRGQQVMARLQRRTCSITDAQ